MTNKTAMQVAQDHQAPATQRLNALMSVMDANKLLDGLPRHITKERMQRTFAMAIRQNPKLLECDVSSILSCVQEAGTLGLEVDGVLGHAYLIPFKTTCTLVPGYKGLLDLARRHDNIIIKTRCVYKGDHFHYAEGDDDRIEHVPNQDPDAEFLETDITHVYLIAKRDNQVICRSVWTRAQIEAHKKQYSKNHNKKDSAWNTAWSTMARKTVIREAINRGEIPVSSEVQRLSSREEYYEAETIRQPSASRVLEVDTPHHSSRSESLASQMEPVSEPPAEATEPAAAPQGETLFAGVEETQKQSQPFMPKPGDGPQDYEDRLVSQIDAAESQEHLGHILAAIERSGEDKFLNPAQVEDLKHRIDTRAGEV